MEQTLISRLGLTYGFGFPEVSMKHLYALAYMDTLTDTYNRNMLEALRDRLNAEETIVGFVDIDNLKLVNDTLGHDEGDDLLVLVAQSIKSKVELLFRLGGDEFLFFNYEMVNLEDLPGVSYGQIRKWKQMPLEQAMRLADKQMYEHKNRKGVQR